MEMRIDIIREQRDELLEALQSLLYGMVDGEGAVTPGGDSLKAYYQSGTLAKARAAIKKATQP